MSQGRREGLRSEILRVLSVSDPAGKKSKDRIEVIVEQLFGV